MKSPRVDRDEENGRVSLEITKRIEQNKRSPHEEGFPTGIKSSSN
jgi:hypothetical protein